MSLDLNKVARQIEGMAENLARSSMERQSRLREALALFHAQAEDFDALSEKIRRSRGHVTWLVPELTGRFDGRYPAPPVPENFTVIGCDGSHIDVDRHRQARCFLINIGAVTLSYGKSPVATLDSFPQLYFGDENTYLFPPKGDFGWELSIDGALLGVKRSVSEVEKLAELTAGLPEGTPALALIDGSLILWGLANRDYPDFVAETLLDKGLLIHLDKIQGQNASKRVVPAAYISFPRSADVVSALRVAICPHETPDCDRDCRNTAFGERECDKISGIQDRDIFSELLGYGERSALFISGSKINNRYEKHRVHFFYLKLEDEVARIEVPEWAARDEELLSLTHALILDQCRRGFGYPVALSEAHEQAVVTASDRENFWMLTEACLEMEKMPTSGSAKNFSKRTRWI